MKKYHFIPFLILCVVLISCKTEVKPDIAQTEIESAKTPFIWEGANIYFLLTDRFNDADKSNNVSFDRTEKTAVLRGFEGGDIKGITQKINEGYFNDLGINAIWFTPVVEQIHGSVDEGTGNTYGFHGYWAKDWTALDPNFGTYKDLEELVTTAHQSGIRIIMDVVLNHTGPLTSIDPSWGEDWVRTGPACTYQSYESTTACTLVTNLPDIKTASEQEVELPANLINKWKEEGRFEQETKELNAFFASSNLKKTPRNYIIKWLTDYIRELGIDAFRVDTAKHVEEDAWGVLRQEADRAFDQFKNDNPDKVMDSNSFFMLGEVYNYTINAGRNYDFGDKKVDYFSNGFDNLINFQFKYDAQGDYELMFSKYDSILHNQLKGKSIVNYATSHDDGDPYDKNREKPYETATKLLLTPGLSQIYYGDETARDLTIEGANGDATLRSFMNWDSIDSTETKNILTHWQKLGRFRRDHPAIGAGTHQMLSEAPYVFSRTYIENDLNDKVVIGLDLPNGEKTINTKSVFKDGTKVIDTYSNTEATVENGEVKLNTQDTIVLLEEIKS